MTFSHQFADQLAKLLQFRDRGQHITNFLHGLFLFLKRWWPALIWMGFILIASSDAASMGNTHHFLMAVLRRFHAPIADASVQEINMVLRKAMHVVQFAVLAVLVWRAHRGLDQPDHGSSLRGAGFVLGVAVVFAVGSETIQYFMKERGASVSDVYLDLGGTVLGLVAIFLAKRVKKRPTAAT